MLQAYALCAAVKSLEYDCEIIDYRGPKGYLIADLDWPGDLIRQHGLIRGIKEAARLWKAGKFDTGTRCVKFASFLKHDLPTSKRIFRTVEDLTDLPYDCILFGSDQIWCTAFFEGVNPVYFGAFPLKPGIKKISYAASTGSNTLEPEGCALLQSFHALSVREAGLVTFLQQQGLRVEQALDPVLLLTKERWRRMKAPLPQEIVPGKYILVYAFEEPETYAFARKLSREESLPVVLVRWGLVDPRYPDMVQIPECGPKDLLTLMDHAAVVCAGTFHASVLAVLFEKRFYSFLPQHGAERIESLLVSLGLESRMVLGETLPDKEIDYTDVRHRLEILRKKSMDFLEKSINSDA